MACGQLHLQLPLTKSETNSTLSVLLHQTLGFLDLSLWWETSYWPPLLPAIAPFVVGEFFSKFPLSHAVSDHIQEKAEVKTDKHKVSSRS